MNDPVIVALARTPFGRFQGALANVPAARLGTIAIEATLDRAGVEEVDAVYAGVGLLGAATLTAARQAVLMSKLSETTPSLSIDRACCSGMTAIGVAWKDILCGASQSVLCGGFESLSQIPLLWPRQPKTKIGAVTAEDPLLMRAPVVDRQIAVYTGEESVKRGVTREQQDEWALASHQKYWAAQERGFFDYERISLASNTEGQPTSVSMDESPRSDTSLERLARLKPIYGGLTVTAGNAPGLNDGAAFLLITDRRFAEQHGLKPLARICAYAQLCGHSTSGTSTPALAIAEVLKRKDISIDDVDLIEINEAYAATPLVSTLVMAGESGRRLRALRDKTNIHGGAVALGHPLGASGARIVMTLVASLRERGGGRGVAAICGGFGQGDAVLVEVDG